MKGVVGLQASVTVATSTATSCLSPSVKPNRLVSTEELCSGLSAFELAASFPLDKRGGSPFCIRAGKLLDKRHTSGLRCRTEGRGLLCWRVGVCGGCWVDQPGWTQVVRAEFCVRAGRSLGSSLACWTPKRSAHECHTATTVAHEGDACTLWCAWRAPSGCVSVRVPDPRSALAVGNRCGFLAVQGVGDSMTRQPCTVVHTPASIIAGCECVEGGCGARPLVPSL